ncbi:MAG: hypothetical protein V1808_01930 [Candidatus Daviesbacteria bacterium]
MITLPRGENDKLWLKFWQETRKEWFKVEALQDYSGEDFGPSLKAWLEGNKEKSIELMIKEIGQEGWVEMARKAPFKKIRIHIVEKPYTPYLEWEIEHYKHVNIPLAGEEVYLVNKNQVSDLDIPNGDFDLACHPGGGLGGHLRIFSKIWGCKPGLESYVIISS